MTRFLKVAYGVPILIVAYAANATGGFQFSLSNHLPQFCKIGGEPAYNLEVSSPGLDRPLRKPADFERFAGQRAHVKAFGPIDSPTGPRKNWTGTLRGFHDGAVEIEVDGVLHRVPHDKIAKAHLEYDFEADMRKKE